MSDVTLVDSDLEQFEEPQVGLIVEARRQGHGHVYREFFDFDLPDLPAGDVTSFVARATAHLVDRYGTYILDPLTTWVGHRW